MFAGLDGRDRYEVQLAAHLAARHERERVRNRADPRRRASIERYNKSPKRRAVAARYLDRKLGEDRPRRTYGPVAITHGSYYAYVRGCRCVACRGAAAAYQGERRRLRRDRQSVQAP